MTSNPQVNLTLNEPTIRRVVSALRQASLNAVADMIEDQVKPYCISEPKVWTVVEAAYMNGPRSYWIHSPEGKWVVVGGGMHVRWSSLTNPTLIHKGAS